MMPLKCTEWMREEGRPADGSSAMREREAGMAEASPVKVRCRRTSGQPFTCGEHWERMREACAAKRRLAPQEFGTGGMLKFSLAPTVMHFD